MTSHRLKTWPDYFAAVLSGAKPFEVRKDDRNFQTGDILHLVEFVPESESLTGRWIHAVVTYKLAGGCFGVEYGYCVLGLKVTGTGVAGA